MGQPFMMVLQNDIGMISWQAFMADFNYNKAYSMIHQAKTHIDIG